MLTPGYIVYIEKLCAVVVGALLNFIRIYTKCKYIMPCKMKIDTFTAADAPEISDIHLMPCKIDFDGEAKVKQYFTPVVTPKSDDCSEGKKR